MSHREIRYGVCFRHFPNYVLCQKDNIRKISSEFQGKK